MIEISATAGLIKEYARALNSSSGAHESSDGKYACPFSIPELFYHIAIIERANGVYSGCKMQYCSSYCPHLGAKRSCLSL